MKIRILKQESVSSVTNTIIVAPVTPESALVLEEGMVTETRVEMRLHTHQTTETSTSKPWATSWFSSKEPRTFQ